MGAYSPLPDLDADAVERVIETVHRPILAAMARRGTPFRGFLYAGLMLTADGPVLLECNVRLGDPEAQVILPRIAGSSGRGCSPPRAGRAARRRAGAPPGAAGRRGRHRAGGEGLPGRPAARATRSPGSTAAEGRGALVFHAGTFGAAAGRATAPTAAGCSRSSGAGAISPRLARRRSTAADAIAWDGLQRRHDIAADLPQPAGALA